MNRNDYANVVNMSDARKVAPEKWKTVIRHPIRKTEDEWRRAYAMFPEKELVMKKSISLIYYITVVTSALVGLWHFFVPWMFQWYDYLPMQYENLIVGIDYTNYCFSLLLFGLSVLLIILGRRALALHEDEIWFYYFLTLVWLFRACLAAFIEPWPLEPIPAAAIGQLIASVVLASLMLFVSVYFMKMRKQMKSQGGVFECDLTFL